MLSEDARQSLHEVASKRPELVHAKSFLAGDGRVLLLLPHFTKTLQCVDDRPLRPSFIS
jgi:hypothetical protein